MTRRRYSLRGKIGARPDPRARQFAQGVGVYVFSAVTGWCLIALLIAVRWPS